MTKLWNLCPDNMLSCKGKDRDFLPGLGEKLRDFYVIILIVNGTKLIEIMIFRIFRKYRK